MIERQIWSIRKFSTNKKCSIKRHEKAKLIVQKGHNAATITTHGYNLLTHSDKIRSRIDDEEVEMEEVKMRSLKGKKGSVLLMVKAVWKKL